MSRTVGACFDVISTTSPPRTVTTNGWEFPGDRARPTNVPGRGRFMSLTINMFLTTRSGKLRNDRTEGHVALLPKSVMHDMAIASDQDAGRRSLHAISPHGNRYRCAPDGFIDPNRKGQPIFVDERFQRQRSHGGMMFKHRVQPDDLKVRMLEEIQGALRLRRSVSDASGTQHLKCMQKDQPASQAGQCQRLTGIEPARYRHFGSENHGLFPRICRRPAGKACPGLSMVQFVRQDARPA